MGPSHPPEAPPLVLSFPTLLRYDTLHWFSASTWAGYRPQCACLLMPIRLGGTSTSILSKSTATVQVVLEMMLACIDYVVKKYSC